MRAFVTGGTGFVGANIVAALNNEGIVPKVLHRPDSSTKALEGTQYETVLGDIVDGKKELASAMEGCEWVFHAAAVSAYWRHDKEILYRVNVQGTKHMVEAALEAGVKRFVYTSSISTLGWPEEGQLLDESCTFNLSPDDWPYAHSKCLAEQEVQRAVAKGLPAIIVNLPAVIGPRDVNMITGSIIVEAYRGLARFYPPGGSNYSSVEDGAIGHIRAAQKGRKGERYILAGQNLRHREVFELVCRVVGRPRPRLALPLWSIPVLATATKVARAFVGERIPFNAEQVRLSGVMLYVNGQKAFTELDLPVSPFESAVQKAYDWYNKNGYLH